MPGAIQLRLHDLRRRIRGIVWRSLILAAVFAMGLGAQLMGVGFAERPGTADAGLLTQIYYTVGLFVLAGMDLGAPAGGSELGRVVMWIAYFAAPTVTAASVIEGVLRAVNPGRWRLRRLRGHIIIAGAGRTGRLYLRELRKRRPLKPVLVVDARPDQHALVTIREVYKAHFLTGNVSDGATLDALRLEHAERVLLATGDDFVNLDAATKILIRAPALAKRTVVRVSNLHLMRAMASTRVAQQCEIFNIHQAAAYQLVCTELIGHFQRTTPRDIVVLAGFGRFGQTVLDTLQRLACDKFDRVVIIDAKAAEAAAVFDQQVGFQSFYERQIIEGDLRDPRVWEGVQGIRDAEPVFIIGSGDDGTNLTTALWVKATFPQAYVAARNFHPSSFADELASDRGFQAISVADLVARSIPEPWFGCADKARRRSRITLGRY